MNTWIIRPIRKLSTTKWYMIQRVVLIMHAEQLAFLLPSRNRKFSTLVFMASQILQTIYNATLTCSIDFSGCIVRLCSGLLSPPTPKRARSGGGVNRLCPRLTYPEQWGWGCHEIWVMFRHRSNIVFTAGVTDTRAGTFSLTPLNFMTRPPTVWPVWVTCHKQCIGRRFNGVYTLCTF